MIEPNGQSTIGQKTDFIFQQLPKILKVKRQKMIFKPDKPFQDKKVSTFHLNTTNNNQTKLAGRKAQTETTSSFTMRPFHNHFVFNF